MTTNSLDDFLVQSKSAGSLGVGQVDILSRGWAIAQHVAQSFQGVVGGHYNRSRVTSFARLSNPFSQGVV